MPHQTASGHLVAVTKGTHLARITCYRCSEQWVVNNAEADQLAARHADNCR